MKKLLALFMAASLVVGLAACGGGSSSTNETTSESTAAEATETAEAEAGEPDLRVAMCLTGNINDKGWNQSAYEGLMQAEENFNIETAYTEGIDQPSIESTLRDYAAAGYDLILAVGAEFADGVVAVAPDFPDVKFANFNGSTAQEPNVASYRYTTTETGFVAGAIGAILSESGTIGYVAGSGAAHIADAMAAYEDGAKYINPNAVVKTVNTDDMKDVALAKEAAQAMVDGGADVLLGNANTGSLGVIECAAENNIKSIGCISDQYDVNPDVVQVSVVQDNATMVMAIVEATLNGEFTPSINLFGMDSGAIYVSDWHGHDADVSAEDMAKIDEIIAGIKDGSLKADGILRKTSFE